MSTTRALMSAYLSYLYRCGEKQVYGQIVTFESRRGEKMFERYGFRVMTANLFLSFRPRFHSLSLVLVAALFGLAARSWAQTAPVFSQIVVFGDSLSDDGNVGHGCGLKGFSLVKVNCTAVRRRLQRLVIQRLTIFPPSSIV